MTRRLRLWWHRHEHRRCASIERDLLAQAIRWGDDRRAHEQRIKELTGTEPTELHVVERGTV